jgi:diaminohydroxyphosphoribosylaminopyrimidine deaminase/5-amino-6-(5-phosphoribosylamino)uracil reductase
MSFEDSEYLQQALDEAYRGRGRCAPNPAVGAVVVVDGVVRGRGYHEGPGHAHAEVVALQLAGERAEGADLFVTLEPCSHWGRTPPCTEAIISSGVKRVVYAYPDPNPRVSGGGAGILTQAGIEVVHCPLAEVNQFYHSYHHWLVKGQATLTAKLAMSLDGKIAGYSGEPLAISSEDCREFTHQGRSQSDALLTTIKTLQADNPQFNVRLGDEITSKKLYVLDTRLEFSPQLQVMQTAESIVLFHGPAVSAEKREALLDLGVDCVVLPVSEGTTHLDWQAILTYLGEADLHDVWLEAGGHCLQSALKAKVITRLLLYVAPLYLGDQARSGFTEPMDFLEGASRYSWAPCGRDAILDVSYGEGYE